MKNVFLLQLISFYRNIVCKNIVCDVGLTVYSSMQKNHVIKFSIIFPGRAVKNDAIHLLLHLTLAHGINSDSGLQLGRQSPHHFDQTLLVKPVSIAATASKN